MNKIFLNLFNLSIFKLKLIKIQEKNTELSKLSETIEYFEYRFLWLKF